jgi:Protein of unknown function (DUF1329)
MLVHRLIVLVLFFAILCSAAKAADATPPVASPSAANDHEIGASSDHMASAESAAIPPGTVITMSNWQQFKEFMPEGMIALFEGSYFWKMPADVEMDVGPTVINPLPKGYLEATERYASQVKLIPLPDGGLTISGYQGGIPFRNPAEPHRGWKILANFWYRYMPHLVINTPDNLGFGCTQDSFGSVNCTKELWVARQLAFNTDPGIPQTTPGAEDKFYTEWDMVEEPEQAKYTANLTIAYTDLTKPHDSYVFRPALRRAEQLSSSARCASSGSDLTPDDNRFGFEGNIPDFDATVTGDKKVLNQMDVGTAGANFPQDYDMPLGWSKPTWGKWEVRDTFVLDVRKLPSLASGYCYGKRIMYIDKQFYGALWLDLYDAKMQLWRVALFQPIIIKVPQIGPQNSTGAQYSHTWDLRENHATYSGPNDGHGYDVLINEEAPKGWDDISKYSTPGGLNEVMR